MKFTDSSLLRFRSTPRPIITLHIFNLLKDAIYMVTQTVCLIIVKIGG